MQQLSFEKGYENFIASESIGSSIATQNADRYVERISVACAMLEDSINKFKGFETNIKQLKGDVQEFYASGTFNIKSTIADSQFETTVDRSHDYASADITSNWGEEFGLKACFNGTASAKEQSVSHFQRYMEYKSFSGRNELSFETFLTERGISPDKVLASDPIYANQTRIIPSDQYEEAIAFLRLQIAKKSITNPNEIKRLQDTLDNLKTIIEAPDGTQSDSITTDKLLNLAIKGKQGIYDASKDGFSPKQLIEIEHILKQGVKAGITAATITMLLKIVPQLYKCLDDLISEGYIDESKLKELGFSALDGATEGFFRGSVSAVITTSLKSGLCGNTLKAISPEIVGVLTVLMISTLKDSFLLVKGSVGINEFTYNLQRNIFVSACALGGGAILQSVMPAIPFAYMLGNFVGSMVGSFAFITYEKAILSFCISSGCTFFGLVRQDYKLPDSVLRELGLELFEYEQCFYNKYEYDEYVFDEYQPDYYDPDMIYILRRGVIGVRQVGYI